MRGPCRRQFVFAPIGHWTRLVFLCAFCLALRGYGPVRVLSQQQAKTADAKPATPEPPAATDPMPEEDSEDLPTIDEIALPSFEQLMKGPPFDWIVLSNKKVFPVEPVAPRPGTLDEINRQIKLLLRKPGDPAETEEAKRRRLAMYYMPVTLTSGEEREYKLHIRFVREIVYFEDMMLQRTDRLLDEKKVREAFELLTALETRDARWQGINSRRERLASVEASVLLERGESEQSLMLLEELFDKNSSYPGLEAQMGAVVDRIVERALAQDDPRQARVFLRRLARRIPAHPVIGQRNAELTRQGRALLTQALAAERNGEFESAFDAAENAARLWPDLPDLLITLHHISARFQRLRVGVIDLPGIGPADPIRRPADRRRNELTQVRLFQPGRFEGGVARYETAVFESWEPADLGHSVAFQVRRGRADWESRPPETAGSLASHLAACLRPESPAYEPRFASAVNSISVRSPTELVVDFRIAPLRPEALFQFPLTTTAAVPPVFPAPAAAPTEAPTEPGDRPAANAAESAVPTASDAPTPERGTFPFHLQHRDDRSVSYRRTMPEAPTTTDRHVTDIREVRYSGYDTALQGLLRGEVSMLASVPPWQVKGLTDRSEFFVLSAALPAVHVVQFNPKSAPLANRALRRALMYSLDRTQILRDAFLRGAGSLGRVISAPFPTSSNAYNKLVPPHKFEPALAYSLARAAQKELGGEIPVLTLQVPDDPAILAAVRQMISAWEKIGVRTHLAVISGSGAAFDADAWDIVYRTDAMHEPLTELWPYLTLSGGTDVATLIHLPTWLRHELLDLDATGDWSDAESILRRLHRQLWAEVHLIPLWEIDQFVVLRKNVRGVPVRPVGPYQHAERWKVESWFARD